MQYRDRVYVAEWKKPSPCKNAWQKICMEGYLCLNCFSKTTCVLYQYQWLYLFPLAAESSPDVIDVSDVNSTPLGTHCTAT